MQICNELKSFLHKHTDDKASVCIIDTLSKIEKFSLQGQTTSLIKSGIVYKLACSCESTYIGQTKHNLLSRIEEYATSEKSEICKHLFIEAAIFNFAVENDARTAVKTFCI